MMMMMSNIPLTSEVIAKLKAGEKVPARALRCNASAPQMDGEQGGKTDKTFKISMLARTPDAIDHYFFGPLLHDFSTIKNLPNKIALNHTHGDKPIGYARPSICEDGLRLNGVITPPENDPTHPAWDIINALKAGIPLESSIDFSAPYKLVELPSGVSAKFNGKTVIGPMTICKDWSLRSAAACISGADPSTSTVAQFSASDVAGPSPQSITTFTAEEFVDAPENQSVMSEKPEPISAPAIEPVATDLIAEAPAVVVDAQAETQPEVEAVETPPAVEGQPVETLTVDVKPQPSASDVRVAELEAKCARLEARITALSKPAVPPIPGVPMLDAKAKAPQTWAEALDKVKEQNPRLSPPELYTLAVAKFGTLAVAARKTAYRSIDR